MLIDYPLIEKYHAAARRERSHYLHCILIRAVQWVRSLVPHAAPAKVPCCAPA